VVSKKVLYNKYCSWPSGLMRRRQWKERKKRYHMYSALCFCQTPYWL